MDAKTAEAIEAANQAMRENPPPLGHARRSFFANYEAIARRVRATRERRWKRKAARATGRLARRKPPAWFNE